MRAKVFCAIAVLSVALCLTSTARAQVNKRVKRLGLDITFSAHDTTNVGAKIVGNLYHDSRTPIGEGTNAQRTGPFSYGQGQQYHSQPAQQTSVPQANRHQGTGGNNYYSTNTHASSSSSSGFNNGPKSGFHPEYNDYNERPGAIPLSAQGNTNASPSESMGNLGLTNYETDSGFVNQPRRTSTTTQRPTRTTTQEYKLQPSADGSYYVFNEDDSSRTTKRPAHKNSATQTNSRPGRPTSNNNSQQSNNRESSSSGGGSRPQQGSSNQDRQRPSDGFSSSSGNFQEEPEDNRRRPTSNSESKDSEFNAPVNGRPSSNRDDEFTSSSSPQRRCPSTTHFTCGSGECIEARKRCNEIYDCRDSSDEIDCFNQATTARPLSSSVSDWESDGGSTTQQERGCVLPEPPVGGTYELRGCDFPCPGKAPGERVPKDSILRYTCREGYNLSGNAITVCLNDEWYMPPSCQKTCSQLKSTSVNIHCTLKGSTVPCDGPIVPGTRANLTCKPFYKLPLAEDPVYRDLTCLENGIWNRALFRCIPECGMEKSHGNPLIVNGYTAKPGVFPWHVGIYVKKTRFDYEQICGGTLISSHLVVSAAHCFYDESSHQVQSAFNFAVAAGKVEREWKSNETHVQRSKVDSIKLADRYLGARGNFAQDIAIVKLSKPFELTSLVRPVCIDWDNTYERQQLRVGHLGKAVGWGKTEEGFASELLQEIRLPFVPYDQCLSASPSDFRGYITSDKFCAGYLNGTSLCEGDSGGGMCFEMDGLWYLRGVVSVSPVKDNSCDYNYYTAFTYVSHFRDWIRSIYVGT